MWISTLGHNCCVKMLPHGDVGRIVNSFVSESHTDAVEWQRRFRQNLYCASRVHPSRTQIRAPVHIVATKHTLMKYSHAIRVPDYRRILGLSTKFSDNEHQIVERGGLPPRWYPQKYLKKVSRLFTGSPVLTNNYVIDTPEPLPWELCRSSCCRTRKLRKPA